MTEPASPQTSDPDARWAQLGPADGNASYTTGATPGRAALASQLRTLAALLEARPELPVPRNGTVDLTVFASGTQAEMRAQVDYAGQLLRSPVTDDTARGGHYRTELSLGDVKYKFVAIRPEPPGPPRTDAFAAGQEVTFTPSIARNLTSSGLPRCGVITGVQDCQDGTTLCTVRLVGGLTPTVPATTLEPRPPFNPVPTAQGEVTTLAALESAYVAVNARIRAAQGHGREPAPADFIEQLELSRILPHMCGLTDTQLLAQLDRKITAQTRQLLAAAGVPPAPQADKPGIPAPAPRPPHGPSGAKRGRR